MDPIDYALFEDLAILEEMEALAELPNYSDEYKVRPRVDYFDNLNDQEFLRRFRLNKSSTLALLSEIQPKIIIHHD